jgi:hypothetical protein
MAYTRRAASRQVTLMAPHRTCWEGARGARSARFTVRLDRHLIDRFITINAINCVKRFRGAN